MLTQAVQFVKDAKGRYVWNAKKFQLIRSRILFFSFSFLMEKLKTNRFYVIDFYLNRALFKISLIQFRWFTECNLICF